MNPLRYLRSRFGKSRKSAAQGHMTWAHTSVGRTLSRANVFLKKQIWIWPIIAVVLLSVVGFTVRKAIESTMKQNLGSGLQTLLTAEAAMLERWLELQASSAEVAANNLEVRNAADRLLVPPEEPAADEDKQVAKAQHDLQTALGPSLSSRGFVAWFLADRAKKIVASSHSSLVGQENVPQYEEFLSRGLNGEATVSPPFPSAVMLRDEKGQIRTGQPTMWAVAPLRDERFQVVGALALQLRPEHEFTKILQIGRVGNTGETYAFTREGIMASNSRFDENLILTGILPDTATSRSILNVMIRDPGVNMSQGSRPTTRRAEMPLTHMAASATAGNSGVDVEGYRDYRGVPVVGAWTWLPKFNLGVATEISIAEAFRPLTILQRTFWALYGLLIASAIAIFIFTVIVSRLQRDARKAAIAAQQLGQYTLEEQIGKGAMGVVYRGHHAMLRRPTAIKLLDADKVNDESIQRFEREVQITCQLSHPATIAIFDFGRTPEGVFYYAMEYLEGVDLQTLVQKYGPQPPGRVIHFLQQVCGSLYEAHAQGLVHRDIKPANLMLCRRGGEPDVVKVLDFGLVKAIDDEKGRQQEGLTGTPLYMSPEAIQSPMSVDGRSDLYSVGAAGYFLLTGTPVFDADTLDALCQKHIDEIPPTPSQRSGKPISPQLEAALMSCLEKSRARRPQTARDLAQLLAKCPEAMQWSVEEADAWWLRHERNEPEPPPAAKADTNTGSQYERTIAYDTE